MTYQLLSLIAAMALMWATFSKTVPAIGWWGVFVFNVFLMLIGYAK